MKHKMLLLFVCFTFSLFSQTKMFINKTNGTDSLWLSDVKSISFKTYSTIIPTQGLVAWYPFNGSANDSSGNGHNGTVTGTSLTSDRFDRSNSAYSFNGTSSNYISMPHSTDFNYSGVDTIAFSFWVKLDSSQIGAGIICKASVGGVSNYCIIRSTIDSLCYSNINHNNTPSWDYVKTTSKLLPNQWYHIFVSYNQKSCSLYINGVYNNTKTFTTNPIINSSPLYIGNDTDGGQDCIKGIIDDIRVYRRLLSQSEINLLYHEGDWQ